MANINAADQPVYNIPPLLGIDERVNDNLIQQVITPEFRLRAAKKEYSSNGVTGTIISPDAGDSIFLLNKGRKVPESFSKVVDVRKNVWVRHPEIGSFDPNKCSAYVKDVLESWRDAFSFKQEDSGAEIKGLRIPQIGAVHAVHAHWAAMSAPAIITMPTGTGKTETMLSVLVSKGCERVLVIVPTDALRTQISQKFLNLGILKEAGVLSESALYPIVGILRHRPKSVEEVNAFFSKCNVIVTTAQIAGQSDELAQKRMAELCPYLFVDEAHHIAASTWSNFRKKFEKGFILQFTATPFRNDGKVISGKVIFNYPLRKALREGYFKPIQFVPVVEYDNKKADSVIAEKAVSQLRKDRKKFDHILMARVKSIHRAHEVYSIYEKYSEFNPVEIHTGMSSAQRDRIRRMILNNESQIIICVDMLGEGFDLPELKIAAFHDIKKSLPITLQIAGRFTRSNPKLGTPTFIANIGNVEVQEELQELYTLDPDWNALLMRGSEEMMEEQIALKEFLEGFHRFPDEIPLENMRPAMSTVIFKTKCLNWKPEQFKKGIQGAESLERIHSDINYDQNTLVIVTAKKVPIDWIQLKEIFNWDWELFILHWDKDSKLLFINSSGNKGNYEKLAEAVAGEVELVEGPPVFRCLSGVNRLKLQNVGLIEHLGRLIRFTMRAGADVESGLTEAQKRNATKSNIFGNGFEGGAKTSVGCSYKGRIWSRRLSNMAGLVKWFQHVGHKVMNERIDPDEVLKGTLIPQPVFVRPEKMPIAIDWPDIIYTEPETIYTFVIDERQELPLCAVELKLVDPSEKDDIRFELSSDNLRVPLRLNLFNNNGASDYRFILESRQTVLVRRGSRSQSIVDFLNSAPPSILFADGSVLLGHLLTELKQKYPPYRVERVDAWNWEGTNIRKESQGRKRDHESIQYRVISELKNRDYDIIFDDDGSGEAADIVAIKLNKEILVHMFHCKYSSEEKPGGRIKDLYEVCGQAQKSVHWMENPSSLFAHLLRRESMIRGDAVSRFDKGTADELHKVRQMSRRCSVKMSITIIQPGVSKSKISNDQLELLSVTENYLMETYRLPFSVIVSD